MKDRTKHQLNGLVDADADRVLAVGVEDGDSAQKSEIIVDAPPEAIPGLIGMLLVAGEEGLGVPAPLLSYEATKRAEQYSDVGDILTVMEADDD